MGICPGHDSSLMPKRHSWGNNYLVVARTCQLKTDPVATTWQRPGEQSAVWTVGWRSYFFLQQSACCEARLRWSSGALVWACSNEDTGPPPFRNFYHCFSFKPCSAICGPGVHDCRAACGFLLAVFSVSFTSHPSSL